MEEKIRIEEPKEPKEPKKTKEAIEIKTKPKKTVKQRAPKARKIEEIITLATKDLTDKEKENLISHLKEETNLRDNQIRALKENIESTRKQLQEAQKMIDECELFYRSKLQYVDQQTNAFVAAVRASIVGGIK